MIIEGLGDLDWSAFDKCYPDCNPLDFYRAYIATDLAGVAGIDAAIFCIALQRCKNLEKGDIVLAVTALRINVERPHKLAQFWASKVSIRILRPPRILI
jgi:hypothetical protein